MWYLSGDASVPWSDHKSGAQRFVGRPCLAHHFWAWSLFASYCYYYCYCLVFASVTALVVACWPAQFLLCPKTLLAAYAPPTHTPGIKIWSTKLTAAFAANRKRERIYKYSIRTAPKVWTFVCKVLGVNEDNQGVTK